VAAPAGMWLISVEIVPVPDPEETFLMQFWLPEESVAQEVETDEEPAGALATADWALFRLIFALAAAICCATSDSTFAPTRTKNETPAKTQDIIITFGFILLGKSTEKG